MAPRSFKYTKLADPDNEIRLLELLPGSGRVQCRLKVVKLSENTTPYEPLSYCWGEQTRQVSILVDDAPFDIGVNLYAALKRLRLESQVRTLWADAICINQHEELSEEKSSQILLMKCIFQGGQRTLVWLGEHDGKTALAFQIIQFLSEYVEENPSASVKEECWQELRRIMLGKSPIPSHPFGQIWARWQRIKAVSALTSIFERSWFRRVWVIQELAVSKHVLLVCGIHTVEWDTVELAYHVAGSKWGTNDCLNMLSEQRRIYQRDQPQELAHLILSAASSEATDPRDRIYGMLGLVSHAEDNVIHVEINYTVDTQDLFMDITKRLFRETRDAGLLSACIGCQDPKMKSWALRYEDVESSIPHSDHFAWRTPGSSVFHPTTGDSSFECKFTENDSLLGISGLVIDSIVAIGPVMQPLPSNDIVKDIPVNIWIDCIRCYLRWRVIAGLNEEHNSHWDEAKDAFMQMLWFDSGRFNFYAYDQSRERFERFDKMVVDNFGFLLTKNSTCSLSKSRQLADSFRAIAVTAGLMLQFLRGDDFLEVAELYFDMVHPKRRRMTKTEKGRLGLVPREALPGDKVVLIAGSIAPFILRPANSSRYRVVGDCCIHGIMDGEAWDETQTATIWLE